jgi:hemerythrin HHE cation binding domain-containing protein
MDLQSALEDLTSNDHRATALLRREHEAILGAFREYHDAARGPRETIAQRIAVLIEIHDRVERSVVYPALVPYYGPLVRAFLTEHDQISSRIAAMRESGNSAADVLASIDRLEHLAREHIGREESALLAAVERDQPGLNVRLYASIVAEKERLAGTVEDLESRS